MADIVLRLYGKGLWFVNNFWIIKNVVFNTLKIVLYLRVL